MAQTFTYVECRSRSCGKRERDDWVAGSLYAERADVLASPLVQGRLCSTFVRMHHHLNGECAGWWGLKERGTCRSCGGPVRQITITGRKVDDQPCGDRCLTARGPSCDCSCGGENHGINSVGG